IAKPIEGRVVNKETGEPVEGAVVVAQWILATPPEGKENDYWIVIETVTDAEGKYSIPGWGPEGRPRSRWLDKYDPALEVFKPGYWPEGLANRPEGVLGAIGINPRGTRVRESYWNGKDIQFIPFKIGETIGIKELYPFETSDERIAMSQEKWAEEIDSVQNDVNWGGVGKKWTAQDWLRIKSLVRLIHDACLKLPSQLQSNLRGLPDEYKKLLLGDAPACPAESSSSG
ncbi:MAG TPA: carboxypeptidase-like regulatory domain-containing protein, partial [Nitrospiria bacterium]|nr:carboxypeptidase-like regulatory domain-containing protein [Nitrospiria bacterium]